ncbi:hypothetical protein Tco_0122485 [Tanacetum coccineum]
MHNNIMAARSRDQPPMLATGSCDIPAVPAANMISQKNSRLTAVETLLNMSPENKDHYQSEKEAIHCY